jgi:hypothetical protein
MVADPVVHVVVPKRVRYSGDTMMRNPRRFTNAVTGTVVSFAQLRTGNIHTVSCYTCGLGIHSCMMCKDMVAMVRKAAHYHFPKQHCQNQAKDREHKLVLMLVVAFARTAAVQHQPLMISLALMWPLS